MFTLRIIIVVISLITAQHMRSQEPVLKHHEKLSPQLRQHIDTNFYSSFMIAATDHRAIVQTITNDYPSSVVVAVYEPAHIVVVRMKGGQLLRLLSDKRVLFADRLRQPREEISIAGFDLGANKINTVHYTWPALNGSGLVVSVKENRPDTLDIDFKGRYAATTLVSPLFTNHATIMATIIAGAGNTFHDGRGAAWATTITSSNFATLLPDPNSAYQQYKITVQNHSYGTGIENFYGADAAAYDASVNSNPALVHVFSVGNSGTQTGTGAYTGINGYANSTGSFKMAKNIITAGHTTATGEVPPLSSKGPAYDGRLMPHVVAYGEDGSSGAAALTSGTCLLLQQAYREANANALPPASLIRAVLFNSADDVASPGIDFRSGFGQVNAFKGVQTIINGFHMTGTVSNGNTTSFPLTIPAGTRKIKLTLTWDEPPAIPNATRALINDLDLTLSLPSASQTWWPWVLNPFPHIDSLQQLPQRKKDSLNNAEQITIDNPIAGNYTIQVNGYRVTGSQAFTIAYQLDTAGSFRWYAPFDNDAVTSGTPHLVRWASHDDIPTGRLEYSTDGTTWQLINNAVDLAAGHYSWTTPAIFSNAWLKMTIGTASYTTDTFTISSPLHTRVGFNCPDSFLLYWDKRTAPSGYQVYRLGDKYLEPIASTTDTTIVLAKNTNTSLYYTVAPLLQQRPGIKAYTFDYTAQGVNCYIKSFFATLNGSTVTLDLELGTSYRVQRITWEKFNGNTYTPLQSTTGISGLIYTYSDNNLTKGGNRYRARIELNNGTIIYSQPETIYYFSNSDYIFFPNPAMQSQPITIVSKNIDGARLQVCNSMGVLVFEMILDDAVKTIPAGLLAKGVYVCRIYKTGINTTVQKIVVY